MPSEWLHLAIRDYYHSIKNYDRWLASLKVEKGEMFREEFCENYCQHFPCKNCNKKGREKCEYCQASCGIGGGNFVCALKVSQSYSTTVCYFAQQCLEKFLKHLLGVSCIKRPKKHNLVKLLMELPRDLIPKIWILTNCIHYLKNYNIARYSINITLEEVEDCKECVEKIFPSLVNLSNEGELL